MRLFEVCRNYLARSQSEFMSKQQCHQHAANPSASRSMSEVWDGRVGRSGSQVGPRAAGLVIRRTQRNRDQQASLNSCFGLVQHAFCGSDRQVCRLSGRNIENLHLLAVRVQKGFYRTSAASKVEATSVVEVKHGDDSPRR